MKKSKEIYFWNGKQLFVVDEHGTRVLTKELLIPLRIAKKLMSQ